MTDTTTVWVLFWSAFFYTPPPERQLNGGAQMVGIYFTKRECLAAKNKVTFAQETAARAHKLVVECKTGDLRYEMPNPYLR